MFNLRRDKFKDPKVREAIGLMFNFEWSNKTLFFDLYARINSVWENSWLAAEGAPSPEEAAILKPLVDEGLLDASILTEPVVMAPTSGDRQLDRNNLRAASALLDEAGWAVGDDGLRRNAAGETLRVEFLNDSPTFDRVILPFIREWADSAAPLTATQLFVASQQSHLLRTATVRATAFTSSGSSKISSTVA